MIGQGCAQGLKASRSRSQPVAMPTTDAIRSGRSVSICSPDRCTTRLGWGQQRFEARSAATGHELVVGTGDDQEITLEEGKVPGGLDAAQTERGKQRAERAQHDGAAS